MVRDRYPWPIEYFHWYNRKLLNDDIVYPSIYLYEPNERNIVKDIINANKISKVKI